MIELGSKVLCHQITHEIFFLFLSSPLVGYLGGFEVILSLIVVFYDYKSRIYTFYIQVSPCTQAFLCFFLSGS